ncbi:MAG: ATPase, T2SS/T4P/T4SS family [bacterium]
MIEFDEDKQNKKIHDLYTQEEEDLAQLLGSRYNIPYIDLTGIPINTDALRLINEQESRANKIACFGIVGKKVQVAAATPQKDETKNSLQVLKDRGYIPELFICSSKSLEKAWIMYKEISFAFETKAGSLDISSDEVENFVKQVHSIEDISKLITEALGLKKTYRTSKLLAIIMAGAISNKASDIHIEAEETFAKIRYRLDGVLIDILQFDKDTYNSLLSRLKLLSNLKLNIKDSAQDGRFSVKIYNTDMEIRTSTLPGAYGESVVMRILNPNSISVPMEDLGFPPKLLKLLEHEITRPNGMILITGPTGSGKTTSLYAFLKKVHTSEIKIITIEDPIEYHLPGVVQTQVETKQGYTFASGLRAALRQDPDVIMVGEIRDGETAEIAINASLTGHLVFSTLHTNDAAGAFPRLIDLGANSRVLSSALSLTMAQRLVRKICPDCKKEFPLTDEKKKLLQRIVNVMPADEKPTGEIKAYTGEGCDKCNKTGFRGRLGVYEAITIDKNIEDVVESSPSEREIWKAARPQGILTMAEDGVKKVLTGVTSLDELERVVDLEADLYYSEPESTEPVQAINL